MEGARERRRGRDPTSDWAARGRRSGPTPPPSSPGSTLSCPRAASTSAAPTPTSSRTSNGSSPPGITSGANSTRSRRRSTGAGGTARARSWPPDPAAGTRNNRWSKRPRTYPRGSAYAWTRICASAWSPLATRRKTTTSTSRQETRGAASDYRAPLRTK